MLKTLKQLIKLKITGRCVVHEEEDSKSPGARLNTFPIKVNITELNMTSPRRGSFATDLVPYVINKMALSSAVPNSSAQTSA